MASTDVLSPDICQRIYQDFVEIPWISLYHILDCELYAVILFHISSEKRLGSRCEIRTWLNEPYTFQRFKSFVTKSIEDGDANINIDSVNWTDWKHYVVNSERVLFHIDDWKRGGTFVQEKRWHFLNQTEECCIDKALYLLEVV